MFVSELARILDTYSLEEIFIWNEVTDEDVLEYLLEQGFVELPQPLPVDV